jgi:hypothetical protein
MPGNLEDARRPFAVATVERQQLVSDAHAHDMGEVMDLLRGRGDLGALAKVVRDVEPDQS